MNTPGAQLTITDKRPEFPIEEPRPASMDIMTAALNKGFSIDDLERLMVLRDKNDSFEAKKAYTEAMAAFKADPPVIEKDRTVTYQAGGKEVTYNHASLANVTEKINAGLGKHGLSAGWVTIQNDKGITVTCTITHKAGHSESTSLTAAPDNSGSKNAIQAVGSTISYLERYTLLALTGLATAEMDDDGDKAEIEYINQDQVIEINDLLKETKTNLQGFLNFVGAKTVEEITSKNYQKGIDLLKKKQGK